MRTPPAGFSSPSSVFQARDFNVPPLVAAAQPATPSVSQGARRADRPSMELQRSTARQGKQKKRKRGTTGPGDLTILTRLGFNAKQSARMSKKGGPAVIEFLREDGNLRKLTHDEQGERLFSQDQIAGIASKASAGDVLELLCDAVKLRRLMTSFTPEEIVRMVSNPSASHVLRLLYNEVKLGKLTKTFLPEQVVSIASHAGARKALEFLLSGDTVIKLAKTFSNVQLVSMASNVGARKTLHFLLSEENKLRELEKTFLPEQIVKIASTDGARQALDFLCDADKMGKLVPTLSEDQLIRIASKGGASQVLDFFCEPAKFSKLTATFSDDQIIDMAGHASASQELNFLCEEGKLSQLMPPFSKGEVVRMASKCGASQALELLCKQGMRDQLRVKWSFAQIVSMASHANSWQALNLLCDADKRGKLGAEFLPDQICRMASKAGAGPSLEFLCSEDHLERLRQTFSKVEICNIVAHHSSRLTLEAVLDGGWKGCLEKDELLTVVCQNSGSSCLSWFLQYWPALLAKGVAKPAAIAAVKRTRKAHRTEFLKQHGVAVSPSADQAPATALDGGAATLSVLALRTRHAHSAPDPMSGRAPSQSARKSLGSLTLLDDLMPDSPGSAPELNAVAAAARYPSASGDSAGGTPGQAGLRSPAMPASNTDGNELLDQLLADTDSDEDFLDADRYDPYPHTGSGVDEAEVLQVLYELFPPGAST